MKKIFGSVLFYLIFSLTLSIPKLNASSTLSTSQSEPEISMDFQNANIKDILKIFSMQSGLNFIASEGVQDRKITLYLDKVPLSLAMDKLFKANNLSYELDKEANLFVVKDWGKLKVETVTKVFFLKFATVSSSSMKEEMGKTINEQVSFGTTSSQGGGGGGGGGSSSSASGSGGKWAVEKDAGITRAIKNLLSESGSVMEDFRTNSLIVTDTPDRMAVIAEVIAALDVAVPQVLLEVEMLDVSKNAVDQLGVNWPTTLAAMTVPGSREFNMFGSKGLDGRGRTIDPEKGVFGGGTTQWDFGAWDATKFGPSILTVLGATLTLDFLRSQTDTKFLARPKLLTLSNETAEIRISTNETIGVTQSSISAGGSAGTTTASAERSQTGVILRVTPQVNTGSGEITMFIYPKVAEAVASTLVSSLGTFKDPEERSTKTLVRIKDGETVVIGGLIRNEYVNQETKLPGLSNIPFLGALFRHKGGTANNPDKNKERELLVFITPHIIKDTQDIKLAKAPGNTGFSGAPLAASKTGRLPEREQDVLSGTSRDLAINSSLDRFDRDK